MWTGDSGGIVPKLNKRLKVVPQEMSRTFRQFITWLSSSHHWSIVIVWALKFQNFRSPFCFSFIFFTKKVFGWRKKNTWVLDRLPIALLLVTKNTQRWNISFRGHVTGASIIAFLVYIWLFCDNKDILF